MVDAGEGRLEVKGRQAWHVGPVAREGHQPQTAVKSNHIVEGISAFAEAILGSVNTATDDHIQLDIKSSSNNFVVTVFHAKRSHLTTKPNDFPSVVLSKLAFRKEGSQVEIPLKIEEQAAKKSKSIRLQG